MHVVLTSKAQEESQDDIFLEIEIFLKKFSGHLQNKDCWTGVV